MDIDNLKKARTPTRSNFPKALNKSIDLIEKKEENTETLAAQISILEKKFKELNDLDKKILEILQNDSTCTQDTFNLEFDAISLYEDRFLEAQTKLKRRLNYLEKPKGELNGKKDPSESNRKFKLPELELKQFNGNIKDWLQWWGQFKKNDGDSEISDDDKFQYLVQSTVKGFSARQLVESFPPTGMNYKDAVKSLEQRYGRKDLLIEIYIRELISVVINNANPQGQKYSLVKLYDKIEGQLRALKSLGVVNDDFSAILLYPLVESCLPNDLLKVYERSRSESPADDGKSRLEHLLIFLQREIQSDQKLVVSRASFDLEDANHKQNIKKEGFRRSTGADLFNSSRRSINTADEGGLCVFCNKSHLSAECKSAKNLSFEIKKRDIIEPRDLFPLFRYKKETYCTFLQGKS